MDATQQKSPSITPQQGAALLLFRIGFGILVTLLPVVALFSRRAIVILFPIAALLMLTGVVLDQQRRDLRGELASLLTRPAGLIGSALVVWCLLSLLWTPFPVQSSERLFKMCSVVGLALLLVATMPRPVRGSTLYLTIIGAFAAAAMSLGLSFAEKLHLVNFRDQDAPLATRAALLLNILIWPSVAWLLRRNRTNFAFSLLFAAIIATAFSQSREAIVSLLAGQMLFTLGWMRPYKAAKFYSYIAAALVLFAPLLMLVTFEFWDSLPAQLAEYLRPLALWGGVVKSEGLRIFLGHGFDVTLKARLAQLVPAEASGGFFAEVWYDLGLVGALLLALAILLSFRAASQLEQPLAATTLGLLATIFTYALFFNALNQSWWLNTVAIAAVGFSAVYSARYRRKG